MLPAKNDRHACYDPLEHSLVRDTRKCRRGTCKQNCALHSIYRGFKEGALSEMKIRWRWGRGEPSELCVRSTVSVFTALRGSRLQSSEGLLGVLRSPHIPCASRRRRVGHNIHSISSTQHLHFFFFLHGHDVHTVGFVRDQVQFCAQYTADPPVA